MNDTWLFLVSLVIDFKLFLVSLVIDYNISITDHKSKELM